MHVVFIPKYLVKPVQDDIPAKTSDSITLYNGEKAQHLPKKFDNRR